MLNHSNTKREICIQSFSKRIHIYLPVCLAYHRPVHYTEHHPRPESPPLPRHISFPTDSLSYPLSSREILTRVPSLYLRCVGPQRTLSGKTLPADVAMERPVLHALQLRVVVAEVLLQVRQLDEGAAAVRKVAFVGALTCGRGENKG